VFITPVHVNLNTSRSLFSSLALSTKSTPPSYVIGSGSVPVLVPRILMCRLTRDFNVTSPLASPSFSFVSLESCPTLLQEEPVTLPPPPPPPLPPGPPPPLRRDPVFMLLLLLGRRRLHRVFRFRLRLATDMRDEAAGAHRGKGLPWRLILVKFLWQVDGRRGGQSRGGASAQL